MYNKIFTKILDSSIWLEPTTTRLVWLTFIAAMDEEGFVQFASVANLAHRARVSIEEAQSAVDCLESEDTNSSDPENGGRRAERVPGGWMILNAGKYRDMVTRAVVQEQTRLRVAKHRKEKKGPCNAQVTHTNAPVTQSDTDTDSRSDSKAKGEPSERGTAFADWFKTLLPENQKLEKSWRKNWARCYDELIDLDKRSPAEIAKVCQWARADGFWAKNFLSPTKLRKSNKDGVNYFDVLSSNLAPAKSPLTSLPTLSANPEGWIEYLDRRKAPHAPYATARGWMKEEFHAGWKETP